MKNVFAIMCLLFLIIEAKAQAVFSAGTYTQGFGTTAVGVSAFVNNSTFTGWYLDNTAFFLGTINITAGAPSNSGGQYMYTCNGGTDMKLGTRPSNGSGGGPCDATPTTCGHGLGLRLTNNLAAPIQSIKVDFDVFQFSLAQNGNTPNPLKFYYRTGTAGSQTNVSAAVTGGVSVPALDYTAPQNSAACCSAQISGFPCNQTSFLSACIPVNIPVGNEIMLVWWDPNNSNNDPHMGIDNVVVTAYSDNACLVILPVELVSFDAKYIDDKVELNWITATEKNNNFFSVERSEDAVGFEEILSVKGAGNSNQYKSYTAFDKAPLKSTISYYRLKQTDFDGKFSYSHIVALNSTNQREYDFKITPNPSETGVFALTGNIGSDEVTEIEVFDITGRRVSEIQTSESLIVLDLSLFGKGLYFVKIKSNERIFNYKIIHN